VEKMLQLAHRTSAPRAVRVSMSTAVCTVMCREPLIRAPLRGCPPRCRSRMAMRPGISCSASSISLRPKATVSGERSATLKGRSANRGRPVSRKVSEAVVVVTSRLLGAGCGMHPFIRMN
jgi:hypothetical protein